MKTYRGNPAAARDYVEAGRARADEYYLAEGAGIAQHYTASPEAGIRELGPLSGDDYEAWVAGIDPDTGVRKGRLRHDERAVRFVEVVVNGPKSWSLAAALHEDISVAYDAAQDRAAEQIIAWLAQHATTRVGPAGNQIQVPVEKLEAAVVRHHSSRAGDPHRHLHVQINARVFAEGQWRGLHTIGVRDSLDALNGIGHAAMMTDPGFRTALADHGYTLDPETGELHQLAAFVGPFSARAAQIGRNIDRYEAEWRAANPGREPGPRLRQAWDRRAWADARPDKVVPRSGADMTAQWVRVLRDLGYTDQRRPAGIDAASVGSIDRIVAVEEILARLSARRSAWNVADIRGQVEQLIARRTIVTSAVVRTELGEDLTARAVAASVPLLDRPGLPEHLRALTSHRVLAVEADLTRRLTTRFTPRFTVFSTARGNTAAETPDGPGEAVDRGLDMAQREVVAALTGDAPLLVVEGAAGAGKTTTLATARAALAQSGHRLVVVTPSRKAARVASEQVGSAASSAAWLARQHGYRWDDATGVWTQLTPRQTDPVTGNSYTGPSDDAVLHTGDVLLCDEAGMLDQETARALLTIADQTGARVALMGDRHQLPAVGRGGVLDLATRHAPPEACLSLDTVHRFTDPDYATLSLAMRAGEDPGTVFDTLRARGQVRLHASEAERRQALAGHAVEAIAAGQANVWLADTREQVAELNAAIRDQLITRGLVDDQRSITTTSGQRVGVGDRVATRRNDPELAVANRDTWTIIALTRDASVTVTGEYGTRTLPAAYAGKYLELAYASTVHGAQGDTVTSGHLLLGEHTTAAAVYVGMTRGRQDNTVHLVAKNVEEAREQWDTVFTRSRADLGPGHAAHLAERDAARYADLRPLDDVLQDLRQAWTAAADTRDRLTLVEQRRTLLAEAIFLRQQRHQALAAVAQAQAAAYAAADAATRRVEQAEGTVAAHAAELAAGLQHEWDRQRDAARHAAVVVESGPGRFGQRRGAVRHAADQLMRWSATWQPYLPAMPTRLDDVARVAGWHDANLRLRAAFTHHAQAAAEAAHLETATARAAAEQARRHAEQASHALHETWQHYNSRLSRYGKLARIEDPDALLDQLDHQLTGLHAAADTAHHQVTSLLAEPVLRTQPRERISTEHDRWQARRQAERETREQRRIERLRHATRTAPTPTPPTPDHSHGISR